MRALKLIIQREYTSRVKTKAFILTTILTPLLFLAVTCLPTLLMSINSSDIKTVYILDNTGLYQGLFNEHDGVKFTYVTDKNYDKNNAHGLLQIGSDLSVYPKAVTFYSEKQKPPQELLNYINDVLTDAVQSKKINDFTVRSNIQQTTIDEIQTILNEKKQIQVSTVRLGEDGSTSDTLGEAAMLVGMAATFAMFFFIMMYGAMVMQSVVEEKSNRIVEVIISSVKPFDLMMGKIIGVGLTGLTQLLAWAGIGVVGIIVFSLSGISMGANPAGSQQAMEMMSNSEINEIIKTLMAINWMQVIICFILYFIGGYLLFGSLYAMFGSAANDAQEAQQFAVPTMVVLMVAFYAGFAAANNPEGSVALWCSIIPFTSPIVMMVRTPFDVPLWEIALSLILLYTTAIIMVKLAGRIYRTGILMTGKKASFKELIKWLSYK